jgi:hypothetical protein
MRDTIGMAREVKATAYTNRHYPDRTTYTFGPEQLEAFADLVRADEREACAKVCDAKYEEFPNEQHDLAYALSAKELAAAIRNRGST